MSDEEWGSDVSDDGDQSSDTTKFEPTVTLIAVDTHSSMFVNNQFRYCIEALQQIIERSVTASTNKRMAILLAHNDETKANLVTFKETVQEAYASTEKLLQMPENALRAEYESNDIDLAMFFLLCKRQFNEATFTSKNKVLLFLTNNDDPIDGDVVKKGRLFTEAANFAPLNIKLLVTALNESFDYRILYSELQEIAQSELIADCCLDADGVFYKLLPYISSKEYIRKCKFYMSKKDTKYYFKVQYKRAVKTERILANCYVTRSRNEEVKKVIEKPPVDDKLEFKLVDGTKLLVDREEAAKIRESTVETGFTLMCVSKDMRVKGWFTHRPALIFADPSDKTNIFAGLWQYCINKERYLQCITKTSVKCIPRNVQLSPLKISRKPAFLVSHIPNIDELNYALVPVQSAAANDNLVKQANEFIDTTLLENLKICENPAVQRKLEYIRSRVLGREIRMPNQVLPDVVNVDLDDEFGGLLQKKESGVKRKAGKGKGSASKKGKN